MKYATLVKKMSKVITAYVNAVNGGEENVTAKILNVRHPEEEKELPNYDSDVFKRISDLDDEDFQAILDYAKDNEHWKDECYEIIRTADRWDLLPEDGKMYMHVDTGSVDTYENWVSGCYTYDEEGFENDKDCVDHYIKENKLVEVVKDEDGSWKEA